MERFRQSRAILISDQPYDVAFVQAVSRAAGIEYVQLEPGARAFEHLKTLKRPEQCLVFSDVGTSDALAEFSRRCVNRVGDRPGLIHPNQVSLMVDSPLEAEFQQSLARNSCFGGLVFRRPDRIEESAQYFCEILKQLMCDSLDESGDLLKLERVEDKARALENLTELLARTTRLQTRMIQTVVSAADELLMNALLDAPQEEQMQTGKTVFGRDAVDLRVRRGDGNITVTVVDYRGAFDRYKALKKILSGKGGEGTQCQTLAPHLLGSRAGVGLALSLRLGASLSVVSQPRQRTEVSVSYREAPNYKEFKTQSQSLLIHS